MPEGPEIRIMSDFVNTKTIDRKFTTIYEVKKGNNPNKFETNFESFTLNSEFYGKKLIMNVCSGETKIPIYIFMGMSGSIKWTPTEIWNETKYTRLRFDSNDGNSLLLYGGYMGPKYSFYKPFKGSSNGPDIILDFKVFEENIMNNLEKSTFNKPIYEVLLDQKYFAGVGNYLRSTILYYADVNPFLTAKDIIKNENNFLKLCRDIMQKSYEMNGGQLKDWTNPFKTESDQFDDWVFYKKGNYIKDKNNRTFWFDPKWIK